MPLRPLGVWATFMNIVAFGVVLPAFGVLFLVEGDGAGKLVGAGLLLVCLLDLWQMFRRGSSAGRRPR